MAYALISTVIGQLSTIIQKEIGQEVRLAVGVEKDVDKLYHTFMKIQAVLEDAEVRQINEEPVRFWLQDLKDVTYDIEDVLDEWSTEILKSQIEGVDDASKVCPRNLFSPCFRFKHINLHRDNGHRIKEIKERLDEIASEKDQFRFIETTRNENIDESRKRIETSSFVDVSEVFGHDIDKEIIISKLLSEGSGQQEAASSVPLISIVAMGGMGKTTLAQLAFNDDRVKNHFNKRIWVYVSKSIDKVKVAKYIIRETGDNIVAQGDDIVWEAVHRQLISFVDGKHFLLVLDDVWNDNPMEWDPLRLSLKCNSQGSRIIVTTHNGRIATMMGTTYVDRLGILSDEACWSLLRHYAFIGRQEDEFEKLEEIGVELAKKCNGLPLLAKTLGSLLCFKRSKWDWQDVLENDRWRVVSAVDKPILPALLLSYNDLPFHLKQCFAYYSVVPRGYSFGKILTIREWKAQGFFL